MTGHMIHIGPINSPMIALPGVQAGTPVTSDRRASQFVPNSGVPTTFIAPNAPRSWALRMSPWSSPESVAALRAMAADVIKSPRLWTPEAAESNLLPHTAVDVDNPGSILVPAGSSIIVDFVGGFTGSIPSAVRMDSSVTIPVPRAERDFTISAWCNLAASGNEILRVTAGGATVASLIAPAAISTPTLIKASFTLGWNVDSLTVASVISSGVRWGAPRLVAGLTGDGKYSVGHGVPRVRVADPQAVMQNTAAAVRADYSITLTEEA